MDDPQKMRLRFSLRIARRLARITPNGYSPSLVV